MLPKPMFAPIGSSGTETVRSHSVVKRMTGKRRWNCVRKRIQEVESMPWFRVTSGLVMYGYAEEMVHCPLCASRTEFGELPRESWQLHVCLKCNHSFIAVPAGPKKTKWNLPAILCGRGHGRPIRTAGLRRSPVSRKPKTDLFRLGDFVRRRRTKLRDGREPEDAGGREGCGPSVGR